MDHGLRGDAGAADAGQPVQGPVGAGPFALPGGEYRTDRFMQLLPRVVGCVGCVGCVGADQRHVPRGEPVAGGPQPGDVRWIRSVTGRAQTGVEGGVHHAGHADHGPRPHGEQQRVVRVAEAPHGVLFEPGDLLGQGMAGVRGYYLSGPEPADGSGGECEGGWHGAAGRCRSAAA